MIATLAMPSIHYLVIVPVLIFFGASLFLLIASAMWRRAVPTSFTTVVTVLAAAATLVVTYFQWRDLDHHGVTTTVAHAVVLDGFSVVATAIIAVAVALAALVAHDWARREGVRGPEYQILALASTAGAILMTQANDLIVIFLGLEILSIALYVLAAFNHRRAESGEAALKYFVLGAFSSAVFVYGIALTYGATGSSNLPQIADYLSRNVVASNGVLLGGLALLLVGFGFKIAAVPFHMWSPDVYEGAPSPVTGFMAAVAKAGAFAALLRVFVSSFGTVRTDWQPIIWGLAILSLLVGAGVAVVQQDVKRMLAYSSINHAGFILLGVEAATTRGVEASLYYLFTYMFMV
ncbi:MAG: NADH-quinone oxidoreductase subunit N, partial [Acidobacteriota bacterium]|nr:NADH-quinone oxidoreductase subunit N [Acidobacteriota bacterium]